MQANLIEAFFSTKVLYSQMTLVYIKLTKPGPQRKQPALYEKLRAKLYMLKPI